MNPLKHDVANEEVRGKSRVNAEESLQPSENEKSDQVLSGVTVQQNWRASWQN